MIYNVTREEIRAALEKLYKRPVEDFTIIPSIQSLYGHRVRTVMIRPHDSTYKVSNIKRLREIAKVYGVNMTLMEGKWAVEHWDLFIQFVDEYNRFPLPGYGCDESKGLLR